MTTLKTLEEYENKAQKIYEAFTEQENTGIECPNCGLELIYPDNIVLSSFPPKRRVKCSGCDFTKLIIV